MDTILMIPCNEVLFKLPFDNSLEVNMGEQIPLVMTGFFETLGKRIFTFYKVGPKVTSYKVWWNTST